VSQRWPVTLADGETVLYTSWRGSAASARIGVASLRGGAGQVLDIAGSFPVGVTNGCLVYADTAGRILAAPFNLRQRRITGPASVEEQMPRSIASAKAALSASGTLVFQTQRTGTRELVEVDTLGRIRTISHRHEQFSDPRLSPDGREVAMTVFTDSTPDIWKFDRRYGNGVPMTSGGGSSSRPEWSSDGSRVLYQLQRNGQFELWWQPLAGRPSRALPDVTNVAQGLPIAGGAAIVYRTDSESEDGMAIWYKPLTGDTASHRVYARRGATQSAPALSPDHQWVAFASNQTGRFEVYATAIAGSGQACPISENGGSEPAWSPDGRKLYYRNGAAMMEAVVQSVTTCTITTRRELFSERLYFDEYSRQYDPLPDGSGFIMLRPWDNVSGVEVVHDWGAGLRTRGTGG
jgi:hypothetical protein